MAAGTAKAMAKEEIINKINKSYTTQKRYEERTKKSIGTRIGCLEDWTGR